MFSGAKVGAQPMLLSGRDTQSPLAELLWADPADAPRRDQVGRPVDAVSLAGKTVLLGFVSTGCAIDCVARLMDLGRIATDLPSGLRSRVRVVVISTDPARDDAATLRRFVDGLGADLSSVSVLTGSKASTARLARSLRYPETRLPEPPPTTFLFDPSGDVAMAYAGAVDVTRLLREIATLSRLPPASG